MNYTHWIIPNVLKNLEQNGRQKLTIKISKTVGNCIFKYTKLKKRNTKIINSYIINIYKQVKKRNERVDKIKALVTLHSEKKDRFVIMIPPMEKSWLQHLSRTHRRNSHARIVWAVMIQDQRNRHRAQYWLFYFKSFQKIVLFILFLCTYLCLCVGV